MKASDKILSQSNLMLLVDLNIDLLSSLFPRDFSLDN